MNNQPDFEDFLRDKHMEDYTGIKDDASDDFNDWISNTDPEDIKTLAIEYTAGKNIDALSRGIESLEYIRTNFN